MTSLTDLHAYLARVILLYTIALAAWSFVAAWQRRPASPSFRGALWIAAGVIATQDMFGALLYTSGDRPPDMLHLVYGPVAFLAIPTLISVVGVGRRRESLWFGLGMLFVFGLSIRALMTG